MTTTRIKSERFPDLADERLYPRLDEAKMAKFAEMGELILGTLLARRAWHEDEGHGVLRLVMERGSRRGFDVRDLLERNLVPLRVHEVGLDPLADKILEWLEIPEGETPVLVRVDR